MTNVTKTLALDYRSVEFERSRIVHADCFEWLSRLPEKSLHAVVTDPPYGVREFDDNELAKKATGRGGIWRIPPSFDGNVRSPLPRFTALDAKDRRRLTEFFTDWSRMVVRACVPGAHVIVATNSFIANLLYEALVAGGLEFRGQIIREVRTLRGGDRPKGAEEEFPDVSSMPRGVFEPWALMRVPLLPKMTVAECLREFGTGGLRRQKNGLPFEDYIPSERTPKLEKELAGHPSLKPQALMRQLVYASLPLGKGVIADPFLGGGSTIAAAEAEGLTAIGVERYKDFFELSAKSIPKLTLLGRSNATSKPKIPVKNGSAGLFTEVDYI